ncbi:cytochrome ubiquinol oxidase subunit II [Sphingopyxis sp. BSNA05]|uniref:ubiquinol oxidase subunit II n=1 Tax=Sphingopyxis sp. BSNA05 TaxID=1236614 RepID=UPI001563FBE8|nr:ubiquinol oxidase subunit II [Sphingopyxis sp. BSNA05]NRD89074.1 cytochrome ubiquinol oxidase subunit II [Sphingopyxis sp. BSNA05]
MIAKTATTLTLLTVYALLALYGFSADPVYAQSDSFMDPTGQIAADQKSHFIRVTALTMIAIIPVFVLLPVILIKYRRNRRGPDYKPTWDFSLPLEITMWGVPAILVGIMSWHLWHSTHNLDPYRPIESSNPTVNVQVIGLDWKWLFIYPDLGIATVGEMAMPVEHPVAMTLTSDTVMQSFIISSLAGQIYAMAGMTTKLHVMADQTGEFEGENLQYNGTGFVDQKFKALSMEPAEFDAWVAKVKAEGIPLSKDAYAKLAVRGSTAEAHATLANNKVPDGVVYFTLPDANLFHKVVMRYHDGKPIIRSEQPGTKEFSASVNGEAAK